MAWGHNEAMVPPTVHALLKIGLFMISMHAHAIHHAMVEAGKATNVLNWCGRFVAMLACGGQAVAKWTQ